MYSDETYMVYKDFDKFLESRKIFGKSSHGPKLSKNATKKLIQTKKNSF